MQMLLTFSYLGSGSGGSLPAPSGWALRLIRHSVLFVAGLLLIAGTAAAAPGETTRVSVSSSGLQANGASKQRPSISGDGRFVAFQSAASNLVAGDTNLRDDVFLHDRQTGVTELVSVGSSGAGGGLQPSISADGRYVAYVTPSRLVAADTNTEDDVYVFDRVDRVWTIASISTGRLVGNDDSFEPSISRDGRYVAFVSLATNLVEGDTNSAYDIFLHDLRDGWTKRINVAADGSEASSFSSSRSPAISADGRYVAYSSNATNLVHGDTNAMIDIFVYDRQQASTSRVSVSSTGEQGNSPSFNAALSGDGRFVAFESNASNLVVGDTGSKSDVFVHDRSSTETTRVSVSTLGTQGNNDSERPALSADGRYIVFASRASNLVADDTNSAKDIFLRDRWENTTVRLGIAPGGGQANHFSHDPVISSFGRYVAFYSLASNLVADDTNGKEDIFVHELTGEAPLAAIELSRDVVAGCLNVTGKVTLTAPAPAAGLSVVVSDTLAAAISPTSVVVPAGATSRSFTVKTLPVAAIEAGTVSATIGDYTLSDTLTVRPMTLSSLSLTPTSVVGGQPVSGKATLECAAGPGAVEVVLSSSNAAVANPVATSIFLPVGVKSQAFDISTTPVAARTSVSVTGTANGLSKSKKLTVNVAATVSPSSLKFGGVAVGQTSAPLNATLTNKGAVPFSVHSISLTGTAASWFAQTNNCPASLAPGASCTVSVTFKPLSAASKSAKLSIATSATATPLSVSLSGTGVLSP